MRSADQMSGASPVSGAVLSSLLRTTSAAALAFASALAVPGPASAACVLTSGPGTATSPGSGAVVTCNTAPPNPFTQRITAQAGSFNVRVNVLPGSIVSVSGGGGPSITVRNESSATNDGTIATVSTGGGGLGIAGLRSSITNNGLIAVGTSSNDALSASGAFNTLTNAGTINLNALGSSGIVTSGATNDNTLVNTGTINQNAPNGFGISSLGSRDTIRNTGVISSFAGGSFGIMARGSSASITNSGRITTRGSSTPAVGSFGDGSTVINASGGTITTTGFSAFGLTASANRNRLTNAGTVTTSGDFARAVDAFGSFNSLVNNGTITTTGLLAHGLYAAFGSSNTLTNNGTIDARGNFANGISTAGSRSVLTNNGTITTAGVGGDGMTTFSGSSNTLENAGTITVTGRGANGMSASGNGHTVRNAGTVKAFGPNSNVGVVVSGNNNTATNSGTILTNGTGSAAFGALGNTNTLSSTGTITTSGQNSHGIVAFGSGNVLTNAGTIATSGPGAVGMGAVQGQSNSLVNSGTVSTQGASAAGLIVSGSDNVVTNSGTVETTGDNAEGISLGSGTRNIAFNSGVVTTRNGPGAFLATNAASPAIVIFPGFVIGPFPADTATLVNQATGTITSQGTFAVLGGNGEDRVENFGRLATGVAGGAAVDLRNGNDTLLLGTTSVIGGNALGGAGTDTLVLGGPGSAAFDVSEIGTAAKYQGFELFRKEGASTWTLTGSGNQDWTIAQGTLRADTNSLQGNVSNGAALVFAQDFDGTYGGTVSGPGTLAKDGAGTVTLAGNSPFTGSTSVLAGGLLVNGSLSGSTVDVLGGTLGGTGRVQGLNALSGGTVAPGVGGIGTLTVTGNASFAPGSVFRVDANAAGQSDRLTVEGAVTLAGGTVQVLAAPAAFGPRTTFTIVSAQGGLTGAFSGATVNLPFLDPSLSTDGNDVLLTLTRNPTFLTRQALTGNEAGVARVLDAGPTDNPLFLAAAGGGPADTRTILNLLSGEVHASAVTAAVEESRLVRDAVLDRLRGLGIPAGGQAQSAFVAFAADAPGPRPAVAVLVRTIDPRAFALWGQGFGSWGRTDGDAGTAALKRATGGFVLGADATFDERWRVGFAGGYTRTAIDVDARLSSGAIEGVHGAVYGGASFGALQLRAGAAIAGQDVSMTRTVAFRDFADSLRAGYDQTVLQAFGEAGYRIGLGAATVEPFGQLAALRVNSDGFREEGGAAALAGFGRVHEVRFSTLGVRAEARLTEAPLIARGLIGWRHAFGDTTPAALVAFSGGALPFLVAGAPVSRDSLVAEAGLDYRIGPSAALGVSYAGALAQDARDHMLKGRLEVSF